MSHQVPAETTESHYLRDSGGTTIVAGSLPSSTTGDPRRCAKIDRVPLPDMFKTEATFTDSAGLLVAGTFIAWGV